MPGAFGDCLGKLECTREEFQIALSSYKKKRLNTSSELISSLIKQRQPYARSWEGGAPAGEPG